MIEEYDDYYLKRTNEEYRIEISKLVDKISDNRLLQYLYVTISEEIKRAHEFAL